MPKAFSENERVIIKKKLIEGAEACLRQYGVKKTTVDELVSNANIPKGTFYLFYDSKEQLFFELFRMRHDEIQDYFLKQMGEIKENITSSMLSDIIFDLYKRMDQSFLFSFIASGDLELVMRKIPESLIEEHNYRDDLSMEKLFAILPNMDNEQVKVYSAALRLVLVSIMHKKEIGETHYDHALKLSIKGIIMQMLGEVKNDSGQ